MENKFLKNCLYLVKGSYSSVQKIKVLDVTQTCYHIENQNESKYQYWEEIWKYEQDWKILEFLGNTDLISNETVFPRNIPTSKHPLTPNDLHTLLNEPKTLLCENKE